MFLKNNPPSEEHCPDCECGTGFESRLLSDILTSIIVFNHDEHGPGYECGIESASRILSDMPYSA